MGDPRLLTRDKSSPQATGLTCRVFQSPETHTFTQETPFGSPKISFIFRRGIALGRLSLVLCKLKQLCTEAFESRAIHIWTMPIKDFGR